MLVFVVLSTIVLLILMAIGQLFPTRVFLGPTATRAKVNKFYGIPAAVGFVGLMVFGPSEKPAAADATTAPAEKAPVAAPSEENGRFKPVTFQGITLPGRMDDAKKTGFTDCKADYYGYKCMRSEPTELLGLKALTAELSMDGRDYFADEYFTPSGPSGDVRQLPAEQLAYGTITVTFARADYDLKCTDKHRQKTGSYEQPASCILNKNTIGHFNQALLDAGWVLHVSKGGYQNYVHPRELVMITTKHDTATIHRISSKEVAERVARDEQLRAKANAADVNAASVLEQMKK